MTIIIIDSIAIERLLNILFKIAFPIIIGLMIYMILKIFIETHEDNKKRKQKEEVQQLYTTRKRQFEGDEIGWKKWRDANYKITDLMEADTYY